jgi:hypothetical protein
MHRSHPGNYRKIRAPDSTLEEWYYLRRETVISVLNEIRGDRRSNLLIPFPRVRGSCPQGAQMSFLHGCLCLPEKWETVITGNAISNMSICSGDCVEGRETGFLHVLHVSLEGSC